MYYLSWIYCNCSKLFKIVQNCPKYGIKKLQTYTSQTYTSAVCTYIHHVQIEHINILVFLYTFLFMFFIIIKPQTCPHPQLAKTASKRLHHDFTTFPKTFSQTFPGRLAFSITPSTNTSQWRGHNVSTTLQKTFSIRFFDGFAFICKTSPKRF